MHLDLDKARWLLAHMYDNQELAASPLVASLPGLADMDPLGRANAARSLLLDCIEFLRPPRHSSLRSVAARSYAVLWLRYVEGMGIPQVGEELALSERQTHRELRAAEAKLTEALTAQLDNLGRSPAAVRMPDDDSGELAVTTRPAQVRLQQVLAAATATVAPLARALGVDLRLEAEVAEGETFTDEGILRQLLIQALSLALQSAPGGSVLVQTAVAEGQAVLSVRFRAAERPPNGEMLEALRRIAATIGLAWREQQGDEGRCCLSLAVPLRQPRHILVIEDSAAAIELYRRYLEPSGEWRVVGVSEPRLAHDMARSLHPALIILDLLMPGTDGWTILNLLRAHEATVAIPVVVCSVFQDPLLAEALGAKAHLRKPVSQAQLLAAVRRWAL